MLSPHAEELSLDIRKARQSGDKKEVARVRKLLHDEYVVQEISDMERCELLHLLASPIYGQ